METSLLLLALGFLGLVYLIFKFIKKAVFAVIAVVFVILLIFGGTIGLVYLDMNNLAAQNDFDVQLILVEEGNYILGANIPVKDQDLGMDDVEGIPKTKVESIEVDEITKEDNLFIISVEKEFLEQIMVDSFEFDGIELPEEMSEYDVSLTKEEILELMDEGSTPQELVDILFEKNNVEGLAATLGKPVLVAQIESYLEERKMRFRTAVFLVALTGSLDNEANILKIIEGYKDEGNVEVYPDRLTFKLVRVLPASTILGFLGADES